MSALCNPIMNFKLKIWRQKNRQSRGKLVDYEVRDISPDTSFLEMLDILNEDLLRAGGEPVAFDSDCREGICGTCSLTVNGEAHGPDHPGAVCELYMRKFRDGETITVEPFRVGAFPIVKDLAVDRIALDRIVQAGGFISARAVPPTTRRIASRASQNVIAFRTRTSTVPDRDPLLHASPTDQHLYCSESRRRPLNPSRTLARRRLLVA